MRRFLLIARWGNLTVTVAQLFKKILNNKEINSKKQSK